MKPTGRKQIPKELASWCPAPATYCWGARGLFMERPALPSTLGSLEELQSQASSVLPNVPSRALGISRHLIMLLRVYYRDCHLAFLEALEDITALS